MRTAATARRALGVAVALVVAGALGSPSPAAAHGLEGRADLPAPSWLFAWAAAAALAISFFLLAALRPTPRLERSPERPLARIPVGLEAAAGAVGVAALAIVVWSGLAGTQQSDQNLTPTAVYIVFWVAVPLGSVLFGDIFRALNPWRALARAGAWGLARAGLRREPPLRYPAALGRWPAAAGIAVFLWIELVAANPDSPRMLAALALAYAVVQIAAMALFGVETWSTRGDAFGVLFGLFGRLSPLAVRDRVLILRRPLSGAASLDILPGTVALLCVTIGGTTFDGAINSAMWRDGGGSLRDGFADLGAAPSTAAQLAGTIGLAIAIVVVALLYAIGVAGMRHAGPRDPGHLGKRFAHILLPIAAAYALAHYFSLLVLQGQSLRGLASDPLGRGADIFGTAGAAIDYNVISGTEIWYVQAVALLVGHACGLLLAHDRALVTWPRLEQAIRSQYWMLAVTMGYTGMGLWLLSAVST